jgi:trimeric autotransporter adhesin
MRKVNKCRVSPWRCSIALAGVIAGSVFNLRPTPALAQTCLFPTMQSEIQFSAVAGTKNPPPQEIILKPVLPSLSFRCATPGVGWLKLTSSGGRAPASVSVSVDASALTEGVYTSVVSIYGAVHAPSAWPAPFECRQDLQVRLAVSPSPLSLASVVNAASFQAGPVSPGEIVTLWGAGIGVTNLVKASVGNDGVFPSVLAMTRVLFDGMAAPLIYVSANQLSAVAPYPIRGRLSTKVQIEYQSSRSNYLEMRVADSAPGIFTLTQTGRGQGAVLNEDYTINSPENPAKAGSILMIYATGEGQTDPPGIDGKPAGSQTLPKPLLPVMVGINNAGAEVLYAGAAPGLVAGVLQVNARIPLDTLPGSAIPLSIKIGDAYSQTGVTIAVK